MSQLTKVRRIFPRNVKFKLVLIFIGIIIGAFIETLTLSIIQPFILIITEPSVIYTNTVINLVYNSLGFGGVTPFLVFLAVVIAFVYALRGFYVYFFTYIQNRFIARNSAILSNRLLIQTLKQPYLYHVNQNVVHTQRLVVRNAEKLLGLANSIISFLVDGFMSLFIITFLMVTSFSMTMVVLIFATICIITYIKIFKGRIQHTSEENEKGQVLINKSVMQALYGVKEIKIMRRESYFSDKFIRARENSLKHAEKILTLRQLPKLFIESLCFSGAFLVVAGVIFSGVDLQMLIPQLGLFIIAAFKLLPAISRIVNSLTQITLRMSSIDQVYSDLFELNKEFTVLLPEPQVLEVSRDIVVSNVTFHFPKGKKPVLKNVSLVIPHKMSVGLIGPSGAGKSTLVDVILGILAPQEGVVAFAGISVHHNFPKWVKNVGYIPQAIYLLDETILENVAFGIDKRNIDEEKAWYALEQAQLKEFVKTLPDGIKTSVGDRGIRLSGGQRQRIGIARALYNNPEILVLDEATSSLDNDTEKAVMEAIQGFKGHKTMLIVAHRLTTIEHCDVVYEVNKGVVVQVR